MCDGETWGGGNEKCSVFISLLPKSNRKDLFPCPPPMGAGIWLSIDLKLSFFFPSKQLLVSQRTQGILEEHIA